MSDRSRQVLEDALTLSTEERIELAERLVDELERRARRALAEPGGGEAWDVVQRRLAARRRIAPRA